MCIDEHVEHTGSSTFQPIFCLIFTCVDQELHYEYDDEAVGGIMTHAKEMKGRDEGKTTARNEFYYRSLLPPL